MLVLLLSSVIASQSPWETSASPNSRTRAAGRPVSGRSLSSFPFIVNETCTAETGVYINDVRNLVKTMRSFPPRANDTSEPLTVYVGIVLTKLEDLTPERSEFRAKVQVDMYWDAADCNEKASISWACLERSSPFYFMRARNTKNPDAQIINSDVRYAPAFAGEYPTKCLVGHFTDVSMILHKIFNPINYPYEIYELPIVFDAIASTNNIRLKLLNTASFYNFENDLPSGWFSVDGFKCFEGETLQSLSFRGDGAPISFSYINCGCALYSFATVWWMGSFIFWLVSLGINLFSGIAVFGLSADSHELVTNLRNRGAVASGAVLAYVFVVPPEPRGIPTTTIATSSIVFTTGLTVLVISSLYTFLLSMIVKVVLQGKTSSSRWYDALLFNESMLRTIEMADEHVSATRMQVTVDSTLAGVSSGSEVNGNSTAKAAAPANAEARSIVLSNAHFWRRTGMLDTGFWVSMHLTGLLISLVRLIGARNDFEASKSSFKSSTGF